VEPIYAWPKPAVPCPFGAKKIHFHDLGQNFQQTACCNADHHWWQKKQMLSIQPVHDGYSSSLFSLSFLCWRPAVMASALPVAFRTLFTCLFIFMFGFCAKNKFFFFFSLSEREENISFRFER